MSRRPPLSAALAVALSAGLVVAASLLPVERVQPTTVAVATVPGTASCQVEGFSGTMLAPPGTEAEKVDGTRVSGPAVRGSVSLTFPDGTLAESAMVSIGKGAQRVWAECASPTTSTFLQLPDVGVADLVLTNADGTDAVVNLTLFGTDGEVVETGARGINVPRHSVRVVPMSVLAPAGMPIGVAVRATQGRVQATTRLSPAGGGHDQASGQQMTRTPVVAGIMAGSSRVRLVLTNPDADHVTAAINIVGTRGSFAPAGHESVDVNGRSSVTLDLTEAVNREPVAIKVVGNRGRLAATAQVVVGADAALLPASPLGNDLIGYTPGGRLHLVNPGEKPVIISLPAGAVTIPPHALWTGRVDAGELRVSGGQVVAVVAGDVGAAARRLHPVNEAPASLTVQSNPQLR